MSTPETAGPATTPETTRLHCLHVLRIVGLAAPAAVAGWTGLGAEAVAAELAAAAEDGLCVQRGGRISGYVLAPAGRAWLEGELAAELDRYGARAAVELADERFVELNGPFKQLCTDWQVRDGSPNDHSDAGHDERVLAQLADVHIAAVRLTEDAARSLPRYGWYSPRLTQAWHRIQDGDLRAFTAPLSDSYHDVWMALHQDLMSTLGRQRSATDGH